MTENARNTLPARDEHQRMDAPEMRGCDVARGSAHVTQCVRETDAVSGTRPCSPSDVGLISSLPNAAVGSGPVGRWLCGDGHRTSVSIFVVGIQTPGTPRDR